MWKTCFAIMLSVLAASCSRHYVGADDFSESLYSPQYAAGMEILGAEGMSSSIVVTRSPWQGADSVSAGALFISRNGEKAPAGFSGQMLDGDARRIVCMSSSYVAMLDAIGAIDCVVGVSGIDFISNPKIQAGRDTIGDVGYDGNIDYERLVALAPDLVLLYGVTGASGMEPKLRELGIPYAYIGEYLEESPLGKAEWLVAVAEMVGMRDEGVRVFEEIPHRYEELRTIASAARQRPNVMVNTPYADSWVMPSLRNYVAMLIDDAGGNYVYRKNDSSTSTPIDIEEAYLLASESDCWINPGQINSLDDLCRLVPRFADTPPVRNHRVWNTTLHVTPAGGNDYWESGIVHPDLVLRDLVKIFHPELLPDQPFTYYRCL